MLAKDLPKGDKENSAYGTTNRRKSATSDENKAGKGKVKYAKNQTIPLNNGKHHVYFSAKADEFNVRIK